MDKIRNIEIIEDVLAEIKKKLLANSILADNGTVCSGVMYELKGSFSLMGRKEQLLDVSLSGVKGEPDEELDTVSFEKTKVAGKHPGKKNA